MEMKQNKLDDLKGKNPFKIPEGYFEGLTDQIMAQILEVSQREPKVVSLRDRLRPWLYLAAVFAGLFIFLRVLMSPFWHKTDTRDDVLYLQALVTGEELQVISDEDLEYLEFLENQYFDRIYAEEIDGYANEIEEMESI